jgi:hypothetical protein
MSELDQLRQECEQLKNQIRVSTGLLYSVSGRELKRTSGNQLTAPYNRFDDKRLGRFIRFFCDLLG